jgi:hypothetical protein
MVRPTDPTVISFQRATELFAELAARKDIAFGYLRDGCYARAHLMVQHLTRCEILPRKVWTFAPSPAVDPLWVDLPGEGGNKIRWKYHVAPVVSVRLTDGEVRDLVFDPSMFDSPVAVEVWREAQHDSPILVVTELGEPPRPERGGTGYCPGEDPIEGPDAHARKTMNKYLRLRGGAEGA